MTGPYDAAGDNAYWRPLGRLLVQRGLLTPDELEAALDEQERTGARLGEILLRQGLLSRLALASSLHEQSLAEEPDGGFGSGLRSALGAAGADDRLPVDGEPRTEGGFGSGLRDALARQEEDSAA